MVLWTTASISVLLYFVYPLVIVTLVMIITICLLTTSSCRGFILSVRTILLPVTQPRPGDTPEVRTLVLISGTNTIAVYNSLLIHLDLLYSQYCGARTKMWNLKLNLVGGWWLLIGLNCFTWSVNHRSVEYFMSGTYYRWLVIRLYRRYIVSFHHTPSRKEYTESPSKWRNETHTGNLANQNKRYWDGNLTNQNKQYREGNLFNKNEQYWQI